eukprot:Skav209168  [mRNA]  locus=scaffold1137:385455:386678:- [translate_table: standard]
MARFLLCLVGHLPFDQGLVSRLYGFFSYAIVPLALTAPLLFMAACESRWHITVVLTLCLLQLGVSFASWSLRCHELESVLGPKDQQLDEYAEDRGYMADWQKLSKRRFIETLSVIPLMALLRALIGFAFGQPVGGALLGEQGFQTAVIPWVFWLMVTRYLMLCYTMLHVVGGFELALGSFTARFFEDLDIEEALDEWNVLQATLRQVSCKMSDSLLAMGLCCLASVALLAEQVVLSPEVALEKVAEWLSMFYPLILFFLYTILRSAEVTESASRVAPLVNSWKFRESGGNRLGDGA